MSNIEMEVVTFEDFDHGSQNAQILVENFVEDTNLDLEIKRGSSGQHVTRMRKSQVLVDSVAIILMTDPQGVIEFLRWTKNYPGLTIGYTEDNGVRLKVFSDNALIKIEANLGIELNVIGKIENNQNLVQVPEDEWRRIMDAYEHDEEVEFEMPKENEIGL